MNKYKHRVKEVVLKASQNKNANVFFGMSVGQRFEAVFGSKEFLYRTGTINCINSD